MGARRRLELGGCAEVALEIEERGAAVSDVPSCPGPLEGAEFEKLGDPALYSGLRSFAFCHGHFLKGAGVDPVSAGRDQDLLLDPVGEELLAGGLDRITVGDPQKRDQ